MSPVREASADDFSNPDNQMGDDVKKPTRRQLRRNHEVPPDGADILVTMSSRSPLVQAPAAARVQASPSTGTAAGPAPRGARGRRGVLAATAVLLLISVWLFAGYPIYTFPEPAPFSGPQFLNPYEFQDGRWLKANFHAHAIAWSGLTNGRTAERDLVQAYATMGYDIIGLSTYWRVATLDGGPRVFPAYEHGGNLGRSHHLVIGARSVLHFDYPLVQTVHQKQFMLRLLRRPGEVLVIAHPRLRGGFSFADMAKLTDYDAMEAVSGIRQSQAWWDAALSAGRLRWIVAGDDTHDSNDRDHTGVCWTMIHAASPAEGDVLAAIRQGHAYGVEGRGGRLAIALDSCEMRGSTLHVRTVPDASMITFIGQGGTVRRTVANRSEAEYTFQADDTYIRIEIAGQGTHLYLNPVVRTADGQPDTAEARVNWPASIAMWASCGVLGLVILAGVSRWWPVRFRSRRTRGAAALSAGQ